MQILRRRLSPWWLLLLVPVLLLALPFIGILLIVAGHIAGGVFGPPAIWNRPRHAPKREELIGRYVESKRSWERQQSGPAASIQLLSDGSIRISALPDDSISAACLLNGSGKWGAPDGEMRISFTFKSDESHGSCRDGSYSGFDLAGQSTPYKLYWILGDPDSGEGIWLTKSPG
jgi:hypothetical protein